MTMKNISRTGSGLAFCLFPSVTQKERPDSALVGVGGKSGDLTLKFLRPRALSIITLLFGTNLLP
jgi:hypothetical protein